MEPNLLQIKAMSQINVRRVMQGALLILICMLVKPDASAAESSPEGMLGWSYFMRGAKTGFVSDPLTACQNSARNHMGTELVDMTPIKGGGLGFDCWYPHFAKAGGVHTFNGTYLFCQPGFQAQLPGVCVKKREPPTPVCCTPGEAGYSVGNPVVVSSGAKVQSETDLAGTPSGALRISRTYRTGRKFMVGQSAGQTWSFSFDRAFLVKYDSGAERAPSVDVTTGDGAYFEFWSSRTGKYRSINDKRVTLQALNSEYDDWLLTYADGRVDRFKKNISADGKLAQYLLVSSHTPGGCAEYYSYDPITQNLRTISDAYGRQLEVTWNAQGVESIRGPEGSVRYAYDGLQSPWNKKAALPWSVRLVAVEFIDKAGAMHASRQYHYEDARNRYLLTGITDENGKRFATYSYDDSGRTTLSEHADGADRYSFAYPDDRTRLVTDPLGTLRKILIRDVMEIGRSYSESQPGGAGSGPGTSTIGYDFSGIVSRTDFNGHKTCYINDETRSLEITKVSGLTLSASCPSSSNTSLTPGTRRVSAKWHPDFPIRTSIAEPSRITTYVYNGQRDSTGKVIECAQNAALPNGKPIAVVCRMTIQPTTDQNGQKGFSAQLLGPPRIWEYTYNAEGKLLTLNGPKDSRGQAQTQSRMYYSDTTGTHSAGDLATVTNAVGEVTEYLEYSPDGMATQIQRPNGQVVNLIYGPRQRLSEITIQESSGRMERSQYEYDAAGNLVRVQAPDDSFFTYGYDDAHRLIDMRDSSGSRLHFDLDGMGNPVRQAVYGPSGELTRKASLAIDALNRLQSVQGGQDDAATSYQYDGDGNLTTVSDPLGHVTSLEYDTFDRVVRNVLPAPTSAARRSTIAYSYNHQDQLLSVTDPKGLLTSYAIDAYGQRTGVTSPDTGSSTTTFDAAGNPVSMRDARGVVTGYAFDAAGRVTMNGSSTYEYGAPGTAAAGRLTAMRDDSGETIYAYDGFGRILTKRQSVGSAATARSFVLSRTYGATGGSTGHVTSIIYPSGNRVEIAYDSNGRANSLTITPVGVATPVRLLADITYRPLGAVSGWTWGNSTTASPNTYERRFDLDGRLVSFPLGSPRAGGVMRTLHYDAAGRITSVTHAGTATASALDQQYSYDDLDRLSGFDSGATSQRFSYDQNGNRTQATFGASSYSNTISPTSNRLSATSGPGPGTNNSYDAVGNLVSDGRISYRYGADGRLTSVVSGGVTTGYRYNGLGQRVAKTGAAGGITHYVYDEQGHLLGEYDANGKPIQETIYLGDLPVAIMVPPQPQSRISLNIYYVYPDHLGAPRVVTRASDNYIVWRWDIADPFGLYQPDENPSRLGKFTYNPRFPGQVFDEETTNYYNYYRDYDPRLGRYIESDPIGLRGGINTFSYVKSNPLSYTDLEGKEIVGAAIGIVAGGVAGYVSGGWRGAIAGGVVGGAVGLVAPWLSAEVGALVGGGMGGMFAATGAVSGAGMIGGAVVTLASNGMWNAANPNCKRRNLTNGIGFAMVLGGMAPLMSGEAFIVGAGEGVVGAQVTNIFGGLTGTLGALGAAMDPEAANGFRRSTGEECVCK